jgi:hypothetical protein
MKGDSMKYVEATREYIEALIDRPELTEKDKDYLNYWLYICMDFRTVSLRNERRFNAIVKRATVACAECGVRKFSNEIYSYVDGNNVAITKNSPELCEMCYRDKYDNVYC